MGMIKTDKLLSVFFYAVKRFYPNMRIELERLQGPPGNISDWIYGVDFEDIPG
jgi:hypothetical protein